MISVTELRAGRAFKEDDQPYLVLKYEHTKLGRGKANIKVKVRHLVTGKVSEKTFISGAKVEELETLKKKMQFLYQDASGFYFMDPETFEQVSISSGVIGEQAGFLKEGAKVDVLFVEDRALSVDLPVSVVLAVAQTEPGVKGNTATRSLKAATLENGMRVQVPLFVKVGDKIKVDTRTGEYVERAK